jgi:hypothetical protein
MCRAAATRHQRQTGEAERPLQRGSGDGHCRQPQASADIWMAMTASGLKRMDAWLKKEGNQYLKNAHNYNELNIRAHHMLHQDVDAL